MATYDYLKSQNGHKIQVESAKRDGSGKNIENNYAKQNGYYKQLTSGLAENLTPYGENSGAYGNTPFVFQTSGGASDVGEKAYLRALIGNSVAFNQICKIERASQNMAGLTYTNNGDNTFNLSGTATRDDSYGLYDNVSIPNGHKVLLKSFKGSSSTTVYAGLGGNVDTNGNGIIFTQTTDTRLFLYIKNGAEVNLTNCKCMLIDLTLMFGAGNEPTSALEFNRLFPLPYYEYNTGTLLSSKSNGYKIVGYNAFDGELEYGYWRGNVGDTIYKWDFIRDVRCKTKIKVCAGQKYTFEFNNVGTSNFRAYIQEVDSNDTILKTNAALTNGAETTLLDNTEYVYIYLYDATETMDFSQNIPSGINICFHLTWDGSKTGYEPYESTTYPLPDVELRSAGSVYDELKPDGTLIRRIDVVDLGTLNWSWSSGTNRWYSTSLSSLAVGATSATTPANMCCSKYEVVGNQYTQDNTKDKSISLDNGGTLGIYDSSLNSSTNITTAMSGVMLYYELATTTTKQTSNTFQELADIDDFGTQEFLSSASIVIPQGNEFFYPVDYKAFIDSLGGRADIEYDASEVVSHTELSASETQRDTIDGQLKEALGGTLRQVLSVKESIDFNNTAWVDLSTITWLADHSTHRFLSYGFSAAEGVDASLVGKLVCSHFQTVTVNSITVNSTLGIGISSNGTISVSDTGRTSMTVDEFKADMKNVLLAYKKA